MRLRNKALGASLVVWLSTAGLHAGDPAFSSRGEFGAGATIPVAWADFDGDGDLDLAVGNYFGQDNELFVNQGDGTFIRQTPFGAGLTFAIAWADYDNDGDPDLAVGNNGQNWLFVNNGDGSFEQQNQFGANRTVALAWADADLDGDLDVAVGNGILGVAQQNYLYINHGDGSFESLARFGVGQTGSLGWNDFDGDGDPDLAVGNGGFGAEEQNQLYENLDGMTFSALPRFGTGDTAAVAWADADGDGLADLAVGNWNNGPNRLYRNLGDGAFVASNELGTRDTNAIAWGDADLDGDLDLAVGNGDFSSADQNYLYVNDGDSVFSEHALFGMGSTDSIAWGDCENDGDLDVAVGNEHTPTQNELWTNELADGTYLAVRLVGRYHELGSGYSNRDGIGARVVVFTMGRSGAQGDRLGTQWVDAHGGFAAQNAMELTFGLPNQTSVDLEITWPGSDGASITQRLFRVATGQRLVILETRTGDLNGDGVIDVIDLLLMLGAWGQCPDPPAECQADIDGTGSVNVTDLLMLLAEWG
jgi:hypothetical protein